MAWHEITHICGHTDHRQIYGPDTHGQRQCQADWYAARPCYGCVQAQRAAQSAADARYAAQMGWPALEGSEKQVAWAHTLRVTAIEELDALCLDQQASQEIHEALRAILLAQVSAKQWISHRGGNPEKARLLNILNMTDHAPVGELVGMWASDPDKDRVQRLLDDHQARTQAAAEPETQEGEHK